MFLHFLNAFLKHENAGQKWHMAISESALYGLQTARYELGHI